MMVDTPVVLLSSLALAVFCGFAASYQSWGFVIALGLASLVVAIIGGAQAIADSIGKKEP